MERLNLKSRHFVDLLTDQPFVRSDIITIQDPTDLEKFDVSKFHHVKNSLTVDEEGQLVVPAGIQGLCTARALLLFTRGGEGEERSLFLSAIREP